MKKFYVFMICVIMTVSMFSAVGLAHEVSDEEKVKLTIGQYFDSTFESLGSMKQITDYPANVFVEKTEICNIEKVLLNTEVIRRSIQVEDLTFSEYKLDLVYNKIDVSKDVANVELIENHDIQFNCFDTPSYLRNKVHAFTLNKANNIWVITDHKCHNPILEYLNYEMEKGLSLDESVTKFLDNERQALKDASKQQDTEELDLTALSESANAPKSPYSNHGYNRNNARSYARTYALSNNPSPWGNYTADCTNFVSIALYRGGIKKDSNGSKQWYWNSSSDKTASWTAARYLRPYLLDNNGGTSSYGVRASNISLSYVRTGDVVSFKSSSSSSISHSAIITDASYNSTHNAYYNHKICQHSYGSAYAKDYPLSSMPYAYKYYTKIYGCYY